MTKTIIVANRKGGVGKTTVATHLAAGMSLVGLRVGLVDTDPQGHCASALGLPKANGLFELMTGTSTFSEWVIHVSGASYAVEGWQSPTPLVLLPSDKRTAVITSSDGVSVFDFRRLMREFATVYNLDYIVVDSSPSNTMFDDSLSLAADYYLYVTEVAALSFDGLMEATDELARANRSQQEFRTSDIQMLGIIPNKIRASTNNHRDNIRLLAEHFGRDAIWSPVTLRTVWESAFEYGQLVYTYAPYDVEFQQALDIVDHALKRLGHLPADDTTVRTLSRKATTA
jgi:chromosome partitioning protein